MSVTPLEQLIGIMLFSGIPDINVWIIIFLAVIVIAMALARVPGTVAGLFAFILISAIGSAFGGFYLGFTAMAWFALGASALLAFMKIGNR